MNRAIALLTSLAIVVFCSPALADDPSTAPTANPAAAALTPDQAPELMKQQCKGVIHNSECLGPDGLTILGPDGKLHVPKKGQWQPTFGGPMVFVPDEEHPHP